MWLKAGQACVAHLSPFLPSAHSSYSSLGWWLNPFSRKSLMPSDFYVFLWQKTLFKNTALVALIQAAEAATVVILVVLRKLLWLSQGLFLSAGVFFIIKKHKNRLASVIFAKTDLTITPMFIQPTASLRWFFYPEDASLAAGSRKKFKVLLF